MEKNRPTFERRLNGIRVAVWENAANDGPPWWNVAITRRYKEGEEYRDATTFNGLADLAVVSEAVLLAQQFIRQRLAELAAE
jgi:hypothetical protein